MYSIPKYSSPVNIGGHLFGNQVEATFNSDTFPQGKEFSDGQFDFVSKLGNDWQKGHLLGVQFGGIADERNFLPMTQKANLAFKNEIENKLRKIILWHDVLKGYLLEETHRSCFIKYTVEVSTNNPIVVSEIMIPSSFTATVTVEDSIGCVIDNTLLNKFFYGNFEDIIFPLQKEFSTNL